MHLSGFNKLLKELTQRDIKKYYKEMLKTLSVCSVKKHHANIHKALGESVEDGLIKYNPAAGIKFPKKAKFKGQYMPINDEIRAYLKAVKKKQLENKMFYGKTYIDSGYVCTYDNGEVMKLNFLTNQFTKILKLGKNDLGSSTSVCRFDVSWHGDEIH